MDGGSPSWLKEKRSKRNQDHAKSSRPTRRTKASLPCDVAGGCGARAHVAHAQASFNPIGAAAHVFVPGIGVTLAIDPAEEALDKKG